MKRNHSIIQENPYVDFLDESIECLEKHHIFGGANRKKSEEDGLYVWLTHWNHNEPPKGVHFNKERMQYFHELGEVAWILRRMIRQKLTFQDAIKEFRRRYGKSYL